MTNKAIITAMLGALAAVCLPTVGAFNLGGPVVAQTRQPTAGAITARLRQLVNLNRNNPAALQEQLAMFLTANPQYARYLDEAIAPLQLSDSAVQALGGALALARNNLLAAGNTTGAALVEAEVAALPLPARQQFAQGPVSFGVVVVDQGGGGQGGPPPSYFNFPGSVGGGGGSYFSPN